MKGKGRLTFLSSPKDENGSVCSYQCSSVINSWLVKSLSQDQNFYGEELITSLLDPNTAGQVWPDVSTNSFVLQFCSFQLRPFLHEMTCLRVSGYSLVPLIDEDEFKLFVSVQEEYRAEGISWHNIDYIDNTGCINLISKKPTALFHLLDEECK